MTPESNSLLPNHIAIIMDGNNRWAKARGLQAKSGHRHGAEAVKEVVNCCVDRVKHFIYIISDQNAIPNEADQFKASQKSTRPCP